MRIFLEKDEGAPKRGSYMIYFRYLHMGETFVFDKE